MSSASPLPPSLVRLLAQAARRCRVGRLKRAMAVAGMGVAAGMLAAGMALLWEPRWVEYWPIGAALALTGGVVTAAVAWFRPVSQRALLRELDERLGLPDSLLSAGELATMGDTPWLEAQRSTTLESAVRQTQEIGWGKLWPMPWPRGSALMLLVLLVMGPLFTWLYGIRSTISYEGAAAHGYTRRAAALEELFEDWKQREEHPEEAEAMKALMAEIAPIRERLVDPKASQEQIFTDLNKLEEVVAARRAELEAASLEPHAAELASALEAVEGMSPMAAALRRGDFQKAQMEAQQQQKALTQEGSKTPAGAEAAADQMERTGEKLAQAGQRQAGGGMKQLAKGSRNKSCSSMSQGMQMLQQAFNQQCQSQGQCNRLGAQLAQIAGMKNALGEGKDGSGMQGLASMLQETQQKSGKGDGVGAGSDPNLHGDATDLAAQKNVEHLSGVESASGDSETTTLQSSSGSGQTTRGEMAGATLQTYEQLSRQAIEDETLPVGHRQTIKAYFERIRPTTQPSASQPSSR